MIKTIIEMKKIIYLMMIMFAAGYLFSCKDMDKVYEEFLVPNGLTYPQKPDSLKVSTGYNKLRLTWLKSKDPSIVRAEVYWNNYQDTLEVNLAGNQDDIIAVDIPVSDENTYTFYVKTFDADGNVSIPSEASGAAYGENYRLGTTDRSVTSASRDGNYTGMIIWGGATTDLAYSEVRYTTLSGEKRVVRVEPTDATVNCPEAKPGEPFEYRSVFLPPKGVSYVEKDWVTSDVIFPLYFKYPRNTWTAESKGGNHPWGDFGGGMPELILDGSITTGWHSHTGSPLPQCVVVDMKQPLEIHHITIVPPTIDWMVYMDEIEIYFSDTPLPPAAPDPSWGAPTVKMKYPGPKGRSFTVEFPERPSTRYIAIVFLNSTTNTYINLIEFEVYG
jgi:hypothetical protein